jgi:hypothetical protein
MNWKELQNWRWWDNSLIQGVMLVAAILGIWYFFWPSSSATQAPSPIFTIGTNSGIIQTGASSTATQINEYQNGPQFTYHLVSSSKKEDDDLYHTIFEGSVSKASDATYALSYDKQLMSCSLNDEGSVIQGRTAQQSFMINCTSASPIVDNGSLFSHPAQ